MSINSYSLNESGVWLDDIKSESLSSLLTETTFPIPTDSDFFETLGISDMDNYERKDFSDLLQQIYERWILEVVVLYIADDVLKKNYDMDFIEAIIPCLANEIPSCIIESWIADNNLIYKYICKSQRLSLFDEIISCYIEGTIRYFIQNNNPPDSIKRFWGIDEYDSTLEFGHEQVSKILSMTGSPKERSVQMINQEKITTDVLLTIDSPSNGLCRLISIKNSLQEYYKNHVENIEEDVALRITFLRVVDCCFRDLFFGEEEDFHKLIYSFRSDPDYYEPARDLFIIMDDLDNLIHQIIIDAQMLKDEKNLAEINDLIYKIHLYKTIIVLHLPMDMVTIENCLKTVLRDSEERLMNMHDKHDNLDLEQVEEIMELYIAGPIVWLMEDCRYPFRESMEYALSFLEQYKSSIQKKSITWVDDCDWRKVSSYVQFAVNKIRSIYYNYSLDGARGRTDAKKAVEGVIISGMELSSCKSGENIITGYRRLNGILRYEQVGVNWVESE